MNNQNLKPLSTSKAREIGAKGGKASVVARRKKKYIKEQLETLMLLDLNECKLKDNMRKLGIKENELSIQNAMCVSLVQQALNGSIRAFQVIRDQLRTKPKRRRRQRTYRKYYIYK
jgi:hypothetical protein